MERGFEVLIKNKSEVLRYRTDKLEKKDNLRRLSRVCLRYKWREEQSKNLSRLMSPCAFCFDCYDERIESDDCSNYQISKMICDDDGRKGLIGFIFSKYGNIFLKDIDKREYNLIRNALIDLLKKGQISIQTKGIIEKIKI